MNIFFGGGGGTIVCFWKHCVRWGNLIYSKINRFGFVGNYQM